MHVPIATLSFLRLVAGTLSLTEAIRQRPDVFEQNGLGICWTVSFFVLLTSLAIESKDPKVVTKINFNLYLGNMIGLCVLFVGILFFIRSPKSSDGIEGFPAHNIWTGFWSAGGLAMFIGQLGIMSQMITTSFPIMAIVSYSFAATGSFLFFLSGIFTATEFIDKDIFYFTAMYDWYMKISNIWIAASIFYILHSMILYFGLIAAENVVIDDEVDRNTDDDEHSDLKQGEKV